MLTETAAASDEDQPKTLWSRIKKVLIFTAPVAVTAAIRTLSHAASSICRLFSSSPYHLTEKPPHTVTSRDLLNE